VADKAGASVGAGVKLGGSAAAPSGAEGADDMRARMAAAAEARMKAMQG
jgi:hypothetical protein